MKEIKHIVTTHQPKELTAEQRVFWKLAASLVVMVTVGTFVHFFLQDKNFSPGISIITANSVRHILLPDSSNVVLSRHSKLTYPKSYAHSANREVYLFGEAFFDVETDLQKPFIVHTDQADVKVMGTAFNVHTDTACFEIGVAEGQVLVKTAQDSSYLEQGSFARLDDETASLNVLEEVDENKWGYATHRFVFNNTTLPEVFDCLKKSTSYTFQLDNVQIKNCRLTAVFEDVSTEDMLSLIAESLNLTVTRNDNVFTLHGEGCP